MESTNARVRGRIALESEIGWAHLPTWLGRIVIPMLVPLHRAEIWSGIVISIPPTIRHFEKYPTARAVIRLVMKSAGKFIAGQ
jgi:hypothetical protein